MSSGQSDVETRVRRRPLHALVTLRVDVDSPECFGSLGNTWSAHSLGATGTPSSWPIFTVLNEADAYTGVNVVENLTGDQWLEYEALGYLRLGATIAPDDLTALQRRIDESNIHLDDLWM